MTQAVCFNCGELKFGSFTECENCHRTPENDDDMAFSMALSDHYFSLEQLNEIGNKIKNGENVKLNDADKQRFISEMKDARKNNDLVKALEGIRQSKSQTKESKGFLKNLIALLVLIAMGVSFISAVVALFNGEIMGSIGLFVLSAILNGIAKGLNAVSALLNWRSEKFTSDRLLMCLGEVGYILTVSYDQDKLEVKAEGAKQGPLKLEAC